jgi:transcriptional regulator
MYLPKHFVETCPEELHRLIRSYPFGMLLTHAAGGLEANHLPFLFDASRGGQGVLLAHVARANPVWREVEEGAQVLVVFRGPQGYISPSWYVSKAETHRHVPTWNYEVVHAHGKIRVLDDEAFVRGVVARLTREHEAAEPCPWKMGDAPADYLAGELQQIVGIEVELTRLEGKRKLSQNRERRDFESTLQALEQRGQSELASAMRRAAR